MHYEFVDVMNVIDIQAVLNGSYALENYSTRNGIQIATSCVKGRYLGWILWEI